MPTYSSVSIMYHNSQDNNSIYLDYNGTTPVVPQVITAVKHAMTHCWGNPSSSHLAGITARECLEEARKKTALAINAEPDEIIFTSGGTESNNTVLLGSISRSVLPGHHLITSAIEHPSVINPCRYLARHGWDVTFTRVDRNGIVDLDHMEKSLRPETALVSVMLANNETGAIQPVKEICQMAHANGIPVHSDAAQAVGKMTVDVKKLGVDFMTLAGHKLYAPKGIGALYVKNGAPWGNLMFGAGQENGMRPGTEPVPLAAGLGTACALATENLPDTVRRLTKLRERLFTLLAEAAGGNITRFGQPETTLSNTLMVSFPGFSGAEILYKVPGLLASTGAACHDRNKAASHVLSAMGVDNSVAQGAIRFSTGSCTTENEIDMAAALVKEALTGLMS